MEDLHSIVKIKDFGRVSLKLNLLMDEYKINRNTLRLNTGTQFSVIDKWYSGKVEKLDLDILARICYVLGCEVGDILQYEPPKEKE